MTVSYHSSHITGMISLVKSHISPTSPISHISHHLIIHLTLRYHTTHMSHNAFTPPNLEVDRHMEIVPYAYRVRDSCTLLKRHSSRGDIVTRCKSTYFLSKIVAALSSWPLVVCLIRSVSGACQERAGVTN